MKVLFLGGVFDETLEKEIFEKSKATVHYAANKLQWNLIDGMMQMESLNIEILSAPFIGSYPKDYESIQFQSYKSKYKDLIDSTYVKFNNIWGFKNLSRKHNLIQEIKKFANIKSENKVIIVYSPHTPFLQAAVFAKKIDPTIHICLIVPDLPQFMNLNNKRTIIYSLLKRIDIHIFYKNSKYINSFVLLTDSMKEILKVGERPYIVIEGVVNNNNLDFDESTNNNLDIDKMSVVYTGTLNEKFGIVNLVEAFHNTNIKNVILNICGSGDSEEIIRSFAEKDERIILFGQIQNIEAVKLQKKATVLVNPRQNNEEFTKYSFPSKNMEYLLTGRPVIAYKLDGIPNEYDKYFYYVKDDSIDSLTKKIEEILLMDEESRTDFGNKAKSYVLNEKNNVLASKKIIMMIQRSRGK